MNLRDEHAARVFELEDKIEKLAKQIELSKKQARFFTDQTIDLKVILFCR